LSEAHSLCLLLAVLYVADCLWWLPPGAAAVEQLRPGGTWRPRLAPAWASNPRGRLVALAPLPLGLGIQLPPPPLSLSPTGCSTATGFAWTAAPSRPGEAWAVRWEDVESIEVHDRAVHVDGRRLAAFGRADTARELAATLEDLRQAPPRERESLLRETWHRGSDLQAIGSHLDDLERLALPLRWMGAALYGWMFLLAPVILVFVGGWPVLVALAVGCVALAVAAAVLFVRAHRAAFGDESWTRRESAAVMCLSWPRAARGADLLTRHGLEAFHPFAVLLVLSEGNTAFEGNAASEDNTASAGTDGAPEAARATLAQALRAAAFPLGLDDLDPLSREVTAWQTAFDLRAFGRLLTEAGLEPDALAPAVTIDPLARAYCPRCLADYSEMHPECAHCIGISLKPLPLPSPKAESS